MRILSRISIPALLALAASVAPASAQAPLSVASPAAADSIFAVGVQEGTTAAQTVGTGVWTIGGFVGGAVLGPIGATLAHALAGSAASPLPATTVTRIGKKDADFQLGYQQAYTGSLASRRKSSARTGGVAGTALLALAVGVFFAK